MYSKKLIIGAIAGDIIGSTYEWHNVKTTNFDLFCERTKFTDDSVLTLATMYALINKGSYEEAYQLFARNYPHRGYGGNFRLWINLDNPRPYNSFGNGSAMRASPIGWYCNSLEEVIEEAKRSAEVTHNHPEGIKGAQAVAAAIFLARNGKTKEEIRSYIINTFGKSNGGHSRMKIQNDGKIRIKKNHKDNEPNDIDEFLDYRLQRTLDEIRPYYDFDVTCEGTVPVAILCFLESADFEDAIRLAISVGGDSDTIACITGGIAEAYYQEISDNIIENVLRILPPELIEIVESFSEKYRKIGKK
ncbi:MAG: ADP-ribosylglycohydrolase family protein [Rickettsiales bacterium]|jgi:ADP-ribosylglycohydrolase|nr:ADP-ribosylglycohydrolase family protein [Rickettsiales bacterium]